jgi:hypothetical protein
MFTETAADMGRGGGVNRFWGLVVLHVQFLGKTYPNCVTQVGRHQLQNRFLSWLVAVACICVPTCTCASCFN